jgi:hypothetical protein
MAREFKPVRFFVLMGLAAFVVCGVAVFCTHRAARGRTAEERAAYEIGEKAGEHAPRDAKLPTDAELNMMAQKYFEQQGPAMSSEIFRQLLGCRLGSRLSKRGTPTGSTERIPGSEATAFTGSQAFPLDSLLHRNGFLPRGNNTDFQSVPSDKHP